MFIDAHLLKKVPALWNEWLLYVFANAYHWTVSWASWIQFTPSKSYVSMSYIFILFSHLRISLRSGPFLQFRRLSFCINFSYPPYVLQVTPTSFSSFEPYYVILLSAKYLSRHICNTRSKQNLEKQRWVNCDENEALACFLKAVKIAVPDNIPLALILGVEYISQTLCAIYVNVWYSVP
jgi:hypothetical protein